MNLPVVEPMQLGRRLTPFSDPDWLFELKYDGFRALAYVEDEACKLVLRNGNTFKSFTQLTESIATDVPRTRLILDGEIVCLDRGGRPQFNQLLFRRSEPFYYAFDLLYYNGVDLRLSPLCERKSELQALVRRSTGQGILYADHIEAHGAELFDLVCARDLEGVVGKQKYSPYTNAKEPYWLKIRNRRYSQWSGREELFERERHREPVAGWHSCALTVDALARA